MSQEDPKHKIVKHDDQIKSMKAAAVGHEIKDIKDENGLIIIEIVTGDVLIFANPQVMALGVSKESK